jgi:hypothetical protein
MLNTLFGWYVNQYLNGKNINLVWRQSLIANATGTFDLTDAVDGAKIKADLTDKDLLLLGCTSYASASVVSIDIVPDNDGVRRFTVDALKNGSRIPFIPPVLAEDDVILDYTNDAVANDFVLNVSALQFSRQNLVKFTAMASGLAQLQYLNQNILLNQDQLIEILKALINIAAIESGLTAPYTSLVVGSPGVGGVEEEAGKNFCKRKR